MIDVRFLSIAWLSIVPFGIAPHLFFEADNPYPVHVGIEVKELLASHVSPYEQIDIYQTAHCGNMLVLDGAVQLTEWDNMGYHEMMAHVPLMTHPNPQRVLIIGGGDGGTLHEVLKHQSVEEIVVCEIDKMVIDMCAHYFPHYAGGWHDPRVTTIIQDGAEFIKHYRNYFDVILVDACDPTGPGTVLYTKEFYHDIHQALTEDGMVVAQGESPFFHGDMISAWHKRNQEIFTYSAYYTAQVPTYPSGVIGFMYASKQYTPDNALRLNKALPQELTYYTRELHQASFILPRFMQEQLI